MQQITYENIVIETCAATAEDFIEAARGYRGVPYHPQGRDMDSMDCGGLILAAGRDIAYTDLEVLGYSNRPNGKTYEWLLDNALTEVSKDETRPGDVIADDFGDGIQHIGIVTAMEPRLTVIHATRKENGKGCVTEQYLYGKYMRFWVKTYRLRHLCD